MKNFIFKSQKDFDLQKMFQYTFKRLDAIAVNQRYTLELLQRIINHYVTDDNLQTQVDEFYNEETPPTPPPTLGTSHQTELDEQTSEQT